MNKFEQAFSDEEEKEIEEMERQRIKKSDDFKEEGVPYVKKISDTEEISDEEAEKIIKEMEEEEKERVRKKLIDDLASSRQDQKDDINDLYRR